MTKSYDSYVLGMYEAIFTDLQVRFPHLQKDFRRDLSRLLSCVETRGLSYLMIDLVDYGKHFDKCLSEQRLTLSRLPFTRPYGKGTVIPRLFKGLLLRVFTPSGMLRTDCDPGAVQALRQLYYLVKKFRIESGEKGKTNVLTSFDTIENSLRQGSRNWELDDPNWENGSFLDFWEDHSPDEDPQLDLFEDQAIEKARLSTEARGDIAASQEVADIIAATIGVFNPYEWKAKHGPGAVSDMPATGSKYDFPHWPAKLERVFPLADFGYANFGLWADSVARGEATHSLNEPPSNLILVPKTLKAPRLIASEPIAHQWCQQVVKDFLTERVSSSWISGFISFRDQTPNQVMARQGSLDGSLSTIDLSEASDRVSTWLVERAFRRSKTLLDALHATRTRSVKNGTLYGKRGVSKLRKFSCMGSACTFPVQSIIFLMVALAVTLRVDGKPISIKNIRKYKNQVRTFGDDIIVPNRAAERVVATLTHLGLKVNHTKTFWKGKFRESCGFDAYAGENVTPVYILSMPSRPKPESIASTVESHNNFLVRGWLHVSRYLAKTVRSQSPLIVNVDIDSGDFGLKSCGPPDNSHLKRRWNKDLHRMELRGIFAQARSTRRRDRVNSMVLQYFTESPAPDTVWEAGIPSRPRNKLTARWVHIG